MTAPKKTPRTRVISLRLPIAFYQDLEVLARHHNITPAQYSKETIIRYILNNKEHHTNPTITRISL